jgi:hypothetical protein
VDLDIFLAHGIGGDVRVWACLPYLRKALTKLEAITGVILMVEVSILRYLVPYFV